MRKSCQALRLVEYNWLHRYTLLKYPHVAFFSTVQLVIFVLMLPSSPMFKVKCLSTSIVHNVVTHLYARWVVH